MTKYSVTCLACKNSDAIVIDGEQILWGTPKNIISGRHRLDRNWGWECMCGNNTILTKQEDEYITDKVNPNPKEIADIIKNLVVDNSKKFSMEAA